MELHAKLIRSQLNFFKPFVASCSLEMTRKGQDKLGELMAALHKREVMAKEHDFGRFQGAWIMPRDERRSGVVLYLHGGGYTCGGLEYAKGFASTLASECGVRTFCAAYRLAPENPYPAALDDALEAYQYLLKKGYAARQIMLCGESAGGGLIYALCLKLKALGLPLPCGLIGISPWTDLNGTGAVGLLVSAMVALLRYLPGGHLYVISGALLCAGGLAVLIEFLINFTFRLHETFFWSLYPLTAGVILGGMLLVIAICKPLQRSLHRKFFI